MKLRQIGDFLEAQLNQGFTWTSYLKLQGVGYIAGLALKWPEQLLKANRSMVVASGAAHA